MAIVTPSYVHDFERCRLLCETLDRHVSGAAHHYILVEHRDMALFVQLRGPHRTIVDERELLPGWLRPFNDPSSLFRRRIWLSWKTKPLRGWHVQQLRRIAIAAHVPQDVLVFCDSDVVFVRPFDCGVFQRDGKVRLFRRDHTMEGEVRYDHRLWSQNAGVALGIASPAVSPHDYISTLIAWRRETIGAMCRRIEEQHGRSWIEVLGSSRKFSECMVYGRYVDEVTEGADHFHGSEEFCHVHWFGEALSDEGFLDFLAAMAPEQAALGVQSFLGVDPDRIRRLLGLR
ncbi:MAG TPA: DUF6492 family protein [Mesorhizobium sp.]